MILSTRRSLQQKHSKESNGSESNSIPSDPSNPGESRAAALNK